MRVTIGPVILDGFRIRTYTCVPYYGIHTYTYRVKNSEGDGRDSCNSGCIIARLRALVTAENLLFDRHREATDEFDAVKKGSLPKATKGRSLR